MKDIRDQTYYELLEVDLSASQEEILKAYNRARATYGNNNPALYSLFNKEEAQDLLKLIDEAYSVLGNQFKRKQYDAQHSNQSFNRNIPTQSVTQSDETSQSRTKAQAAPQTAQSKKENPTQAKKNQDNLTPFGEYVKDQKFEEEIKAAEDFSGSFLQKIRLYKNITLDQISESVKVSRTYLLAIESNNFSSLPAPVFVRGFIVQIAKILGLDPNKVTTSYMKQLKDAQKK